MEKPAVSDKVLSSMVDKLDRPNATVGSGSTAAAVRQELATGQLVGGAFHSQKASKRIYGLPPQCKTQKQFFQQVKGACIYPAY